MFGSCFLKLFLITVLEITNNTILVFYKNYFFLFEFSVFCIFRVFQKKKKEKREPNMFFFSIFFIFFVF